MSDAPDDGPDDALGDDLSDGPHEAVEGAAATLPEDELTEADFGDLDAEEGISDPISTARRRHGTAGAVLAAGLFGIDIALGRKPREDIPVVVASSSEPTDIDTDGISLAVDEQTTIVAPAQPRSEPAPPGRRRRRVRRTT